MNKRKNDPINFYAPPSLKRRFDMICSEQSKTRTSVLLQLMSDFILSEGKKMAEAATKLEQIDHRIGERHKVMGFKEFLSRSTEELPVGFLSNGHEQIDS